jgi:glycosyltransferase involved in cell wall biosynthesis
MRILAVTNIYPTPSHPAFGTFVEQQVQGLRDIGLDVEVLFVDRRHQGPGVYLGLPARLRSQLGHFDADVVHVMYGGVMANMTTRTVRDRPTVVTFHGSDLLGERLAGPVRRVLAGYGVRSSWTAARRATGVVVVAKALQDQLPNSVERAKVRVIPCGIDLTRFQPLEQSACRQQVHWREDVFQVLFNSGGDDPVKRPQLARAAVEALKRLGVPAELQEIRGLANSEVSVRLNAGSVLLLTSGHEGSPTIIKEALACNVPVVSVDVGDAGEQIRGIHGCHLAAPDPDDIAAKLRLVYMGPRRVQARARMEDLSVGRIAKRLRDFYQELSTMKHINFRDERSAALKGA